MSRIARTHTNNADRFGHLVLHVGVAHQRSPVTEPEEAPVAPTARARPRALVFAFACEPGRGSEPGAGWGVVSAVSEFADCVVLVSSEHMPAIRAWSRGASARAPRFVEVPEFSWPVRWRGPLTRFLLYLAWLARARRTGARLHAEQPFDVVHHVTYSVYWLPTPATQIGPPCVWGPVGGAATTPTGLLPVLGASGVLVDLVERLAVRCFAALPATRRVWRDAAVRVVQNEATRRRLPPPLRPGTIVLNHALFTEGPGPAGGQPPSTSPPLVDERTVVFIGVLEPRKGARLAVHAAASAPPDVRLAIVGDGPERPALERLAARLGVHDRVVFVGRVPRPEVFTLLSRAAAALFTGVREEGGLAVAEAMLTGIPVIVLANGGARTVAEASTDPSRVAVVDPGSGAATAGAIAAAMTRFARTAPANRSTMLDAGVARALLRAAFDIALAKGARDATPRRQPRGC